MVDVQALEKYVGGPIRIWVEDVSGEEKTKPQSHSLHKVERTEDGYMKFYTGSSQFLAVPLFEAAGGPRTAADSGSELIEGDSTPCFVSRDTNAHLVYWVHFLP